MNLPPDMLPVVLVIEDDPYLQKILKQCLKDSFVVVIYQNGLEAFKYLQEGNIPDIITTDLNVPGLKGIDFLKQVKSSGFFSSIPVVILSADDSTDTRINCFEQGADDFISKPFNPKELNIRMKTILKRFGKPVII